MRGAPPCRRRMPLSLLEQSVCRDFRDRQALLHVPTPLLQMRGPAHLLWESTRTLALPTLVDVRLFDGLRRWKIPFSEA